MPKNKINYANNLTFKVCSKNMDDKEIFISSTTHLNKLKCSLKKKCSIITNPENMNDILKFIHNKGGFMNVEFIQIEKYPCLDKNVASSRVRLWKERYNKNNDIFMDDKKKDINDKILNDNENFDSDSDTVVFVSNNKTDNKDYFKNYYINNKEKYGKKQPFRQTIDHIENIENFDLTD